MPNLLAFALPPVVGGVLGLATIFGVVWSQTQPPDVNPANQPIISYGNR